MTSSQRRRELEIAELCCEEIERRNKAAICLKQTANELELEKIVEEYQRKLIKAKIVEYEHRDDEFEIDLVMNKIVLPSSSTNKVSLLTRTKNWVEIAIENQSDQATTCINVAPQID